VMGNFLPIVRQVRCEEITNPRAEIAMKIRPFELHIVHTG
jgi:hypothetical protein